MTQEANVSVASENDVAQGGRKYQNPVLVGIILLLSGIAVAMIQYKVPTIMPELMKRFAMDATTASWLMSIFTLASIFVAIPAGALAQKFGAKTTLISSCGIAIVGSIIGLLSNTNPVLIASRVVEGAALTILTTCGPIIVQQNVKPEKVGTSMGIWGIWGSLGSTVAAVLTPTIFGNLGFNGLWIAFAAVTAVAAILVLIIIRTPKELGVVPNQADAQIEKPKYTSIFSKDMFLFFASLVIYNICTVAILAFVPSILQMQGYDPTFSGIVSAAPMLLAVISSPVFGIISDKIGRNKPLIIIAMFVTGPSTLLLYTQTGPLLWVGVLVMGLLGTGSIGQYLAAFVKLLPSPNLVSVGLGVMVTFQGVGQFLGTFLVQMLLGPQLTEWWFAGIVLMILGFVSTGLTALIKLR